jgi:hypothetical protein
MPNIQFFFRTFAKLLKKKNNNTMKKYIFFLLLTFSLFSCKKPEEQPHLELGTTTLVFPNTRSTELVSVETNAADWTASVDAVATAWCFTQRQGSELVIVVSENTNLNERTAEITVSAGPVQQKISVRQIGIGSSITTAIDHYSVSDEKDTLVIAVIANCEFDVEISQPWITLISKFSINQTYTVRFNVETNYGLERSGSITFRQQGGGIEHTVTVTQAVRSYVPEEKIGDFDAAEMAAIFTDNLYTELKPGITEATILGMNNEFLKTLAMSLYRNSYPKEFRVQEFRAYPHPDIKANENKHWPFTLLDNPTGIRTTNGKELVVFVGDMHGQTIKLRVIDRIADPTLGLDYDLSPGLNKLNITRTGLAYIMYHTESPDAKPVKMHFASGEVNGYFDIAKHTDSDWTRLIHAAKDPHFDILGKYAQLKFTTADLRINTPSGAQLVEVYDSMVSWGQQHTGLFKYGRENKNRLYFVVQYDFPDLYYATANYHTAYGINTMKSVCPPHMAKSTWAIPHEIGHNLQTRQGGYNNAFMWAGISETTNNIISMYVQKKFGLGSYLLQVRYALKSVYEYAYRNMMSVQSPFATNEDMVYGKLVPFWQLELYFADVKGYKDLYADFYEHIRTNPVPPDAGSGQLNFVKVCSDLTQTDLTEFFEAWGFLSPADGMVEDYGFKPIKVTQAQIDEVKSHISKYSKPQHKLQYIRCDNTNLYKTDATIVQGSNPISGTVVNISSWSNVVACEVYDANDKLIFVTTDTTFDIPANGQRIYVVGGTGDRVKIL